MRLLKLCRTTDGDEIRTLLDDTVTSLRGVGASGALGFAAGAWGESCSVTGVGDDGRTLRPDTPLELASVAKSLTAAVVMLLVEDGLLALDDEVSNYLPGLLRDDAVTIRSLLNHTSGLRDYFEVTEFRDAWLNDPWQAWPAHQLIRLAESLPPGTPGTFAYANSNYVVAGLVIEAASRRGFADMLCGRLLRSAGVDGMVVTPSFVTSLGGLGGLRAPAREVARFFGALFRGQVVSRRSLQDMLTTVPSDWPESESYGLGIERVNSLFGLSPPGEGAWGHIGLGREVTVVALTTADGERQLVLSATAMLTDEASWALLDAATWRVLRPRSQASLT
jgi:D-alanyl-D-alanine carboxypeptidase